MNDVIRRWLIKANNDFKLAKLSLTYDNSLTGLICFHCQQSVEKFLKAYLISKNFRFGKTHDIEYLWKKCVELDSEFENLNVGNLSRYAVEPQYPEQVPEPTINEASDAYDIVIEVKKFILFKLNAEESDLTLF